MTSLAPLIARIEFAQWLDERLAARRARRLSRYQPAGKRGAETARHKLASDPLVMEQVQFWCRMMDRAHKAALGFS